jgi:tripartite-type tricarboxylate transporter receptor subunit TctC
VLGVPYKGVGPALTGLAGGEIQLGMAGSNVAAQLIQARKIKALATTGTERHPQFPAAETATEQGFPYLVSRLWYGVFAPAGTPPQIVNKISGDIQSILSNKEFVETRILSRGLAVLSGKPEDLAKRIAEDVARSAEMFKEAGMKPE